MSTTAEMTSWLGPFGPGFVGTLAENNAIILSAVESDTTG